MKQFLTLILFLLFPVGLSWAVKMPNLYQVEIPVALQTEDAKNNAIKQGLLQVLTTLTGNNHIKLNPVINASFQRANNYVQEFSYSPDPTASSPYLLHIKYTDKDINALLKRAGVPFWGGDNRPSILIWLCVTESAAGSTIIGNEEASIYLTAMQKSAKQFGLPVIFPILDVADISLISAEDIKTFSLPVLKEAGKRYAPDAYLIGNLSHTDSGWQSQWQFVLGDNQWQWSISDNTIEQVIGGVFKQTSQNLAKQYMVKAKDATDTWLKLEVNNVGQKNDLTHLMDFLRKLPQVQQAQLAGVDGSVVQVSLLVRGSLNDFQQNATIGQRLSLRSTEEADKKLIYEWVP